MLGYTSANLGNRSGADSPFHIHEYEVMAPDTQYPIALQPGFQLDEYRIECLIGSGGFGLTYSAIDENLDLRVAIKEYLPRAFAMRGADYRVAATTAEEEAVFRWGLERFLDEARMLARFDHPNIVKVKRFLEANGTGYIVMEYLDGEPLSGVLKRQTMLSEAEIRERVLPLTNGLAEIHAAGLLHRDIKPDNIMVRADGIPVLIDFGSARQAVNAKSRKLTAVVTDGYAPIEQYSSEVGSQSEAADIYGLGAVLYRCVGGVKPRNALDRAMDDQLAPTAEAADGSYSEGLLTAIDAALAFRAVDRPCDIAAFLELVALEATSAVEALKRQEYQRALDEFRALAELGFATAHYNLANMYFFGRGVAEDRSQAVRWVQKAAERGHEQSQLGLARWYAYGENVAQDRDQAVYWYSRLAKRGNDEAKDPLAFLRLVKEAEDGRADAYAQYQLGKMYWDGKGTPVDKKKAVEWLTCAAERGLAIAKYHLGRWYFWGHDDIYKDHTQPLRWLIEAANSGFTRAWACYLLGRIYGNGRGDLAQDKELSVKWYTRGAEQGDAGCMYRLGLVFCSGKDTPEDRAKGINWLTEAAERGYTELYGDAQYQLGLIYLDGGSPEENSRAVEWITKAAERGNTGAQMSLAQIYATNGLFHPQLKFTFMRDRYVGIPEDEIQAVLWCTRAAEGGEPVAQHYLVYMYGSGVGVQTDNVRAYAWASVAENESLQANIARRLTQEQLVEAQQFGRELETRIHNSG